MTIEEFDHTIWHSGLAVEYCNGNVYGRYLVESVDFMEKLIAIIPFEAGFTACQPCDAHGNPIDPDFDPPRWVRCEHCFIP